MNEPAPKRRRFRYSLGSLFAAMTVLCAFFAALGYHANWIRERDRCLQEFGPIVCGREPSRMPEFSLLLGGDTGCALLFDDSDPPSAIALAKKLFPEVRVFKNIYEMYPGEDNRRLIDATKQSLNGS